MREAHACRLVACVSEDYPFRDDASVEQENRVVCADLVLDVWVASVSELELAVPEGVDPPDPDEALPVPAYVLETLVLVRSENLNRGFHGGAVGIRTPVHQVSELSLVTCVALLRRGAGLAETASCSALGHLTCPQVAGGPDACMPRVMTP